MIEIDGPTTGSRRRPSTTLTVPRPTVTPPSGAVTRVRFFAVDGSCFLDGEVPDQGRRRPGVVAAAPPARRRRPGGVHQQGSASRPFARAAGAARQPREPPHPAQATPRRAARPIRPPPTPLAGWPRAPTPTSPPSPPLAPPTSTASRSPARDIEDHPENATRFVVVAASGRPAAPPVTTRPRSSCSSGPTRPGSLPRHPPGVRRPGHQPHQARVPAHQEGPRRLLLPDRPRGPHRRRAGGRLPPRPQVEAGRRPVPRVVPRRRRARDSSVATPTPPGRRAAD